jgi:hypothetical protein
MDIKKLLIGAFSVCFAGAAAAIPVTDCHEDDFMIEGVSSTECRVGPTPNDSLADINDLWDPPGDWSYLGEITDITPKAGDGFNFTYDGLLTGFEAIFTVKQSTWSAPKKLGGWVSYHFDNVNTGDTGMFYPANTSFDDNDYSHVKVYSRGGIAVPEIDANAAGIALALIGGLLGLFRERRATSRL